MLLEDNLSPMQRSPLSSAANLSPSPKRAKISDMAGEENIAPETYSAPRKLFIDGPDITWDSFSSKTSSGNAYSDSASIIRATQTILTCDGKRILDDKAMQSLLDNLQLNKTITHLNLFNADINEEKAITLADALKGNKTLTHIDLGHNEIGTKGVEAICKALVGSNVIHLNLSWNWIGQEGIAGLHHILKDRDSKMLSLNLAGNRIDDQASKTLSFLLDSNKNLVHLDLSENNLESALIPLKDAIGNTAITLLNLAESNVPVRVKQEFKDVIYTNMTHLAQEIGFELDESLINDTKFWFVAPILMKAIEADVFEEDAMMQLYEVIGEKLFEDPHNVVQLLVLFRQNGSVTIEEIKSIINAGQDNPIIMDYFLKTITLTFLQISEESDSTHAELIKDLISVITQLSDEEQGNIKSTMQTYIHENKVIFAEDAKKILLENNMVFQSYEDKAISAKDSDIGEERNLDESKPQSPLQSDSGYDSCMDLFSNVPDGQEGGGIILATPGSGSTQIIGKMHSDVSQDFHL